MEDKKKVYKIVINGLSEAVNLTKSLNEQLQTLNPLSRRLAMSRLRFKARYQSQRRRRLSVEMKLTMVLL